jgi:hypothetical protein
VKIVLICLLAFAALALLAVAAGKWLERINREFEDAENQENE